LFPAVFTQKGKWLRDRFFGTDAVKSVHGFERQCADLAQMPSRMMTRTVTDRMAAVAPRVRARAAEPLSGRLAPWQVKRACEKLEADLSGKLTLQEIAVELGISVSHFKPAALYREFEARASRAAAVAERNGSLIFSMWIRP
jgi:GGDEF domain-containing protein